MALHSDKNQERDERKISKKKTCNKNNSAFHNRERLYAFTDKV